MSEQAKQARANITEFLRQWERLRGNHPELIYQVHSDPHTDEASLRISDLRAILKETEA